MSECVVRMEMPLNCLECPMYDWNRQKLCCNAHLDLRPIPNGGVPKPDWCPIVCSLPDGHGRLVDADAYSAEMKDRQNAAWKWRNEAIGEEDEVKLARAEGAFTAFVEAKLTWDKQATIVPAERSET